VRSPRVLLAPAHVRGVRWSGTVERRDLGPHAAAVSPLSYALPALSRAEPLQWRAAACRIRICCGSRKGFCDVDTHDVCVALDWLMAHAREASP
jgi:hypothetical protein